MAPMHADRGRKKKVKENSWALLPPVVLVKSLFALRPTGRLFLRCLMAKVSRVLPGGVADLAKSHRFVVTLVTSDPNAEFSDFVVSAFVGLPETVAFARVLRDDIQVNQLATAAVFGELKKTLGYDPIVIPNGYYLSHGWTLVAFHAGEITEKVVDAALVGFGLGLLAGLFGAKSAANDLFKGTATVVSASMDATTGKVLRVAADSHIAANPKQEKETKQQRDGTNTQAMWSILRESLNAMKTLGITKEFGSITIADIKAAHRSKMQQVHPDRFGGQGEEANRSAAEVNAARDLLVKAIEQRDAKSAA